MGKAPRDALGRSVRFVYVFWERSRGHLGTPCGNVGALLMFHGLLQSSSKRPWGVLAADTQCWVTWDRFGLYLGMFRDMFWEDRFIVVSFYLN